MNTIKWTPKEIRGEGSKHRLEHLTGLGKDLGKCDQELGLWWEEVFLDKKPRISKGIERQKQCWGNSMYLANIKRWVALESVKFNNRRKIST